MSLEVVYTSAACIRVPVPQLVGGDPCPEVAPLALSVVLPCSPAPPPLPVLPLPCTCPCNVPSFKPCFFAFRLPHIFPFQGFPRSQRICRPLLPPAV